MSKTVIFLFILVLLLLIAYVSISYTFNPQLPIPSIQTLSLLPSPKPVMTISFNPDQLYMQPGTTNQVEVDITPSKIQPTVIQLEIAYDPLALSNVSIMPGSYLSNANEVLKVIDTKNGRISYALAPAPDHKLDNDTQTVAVINFTANVFAGKITKLSFLPKTAIQSKGLNIALKGLQATQIIIASASAKPIVTQAFFTPLFNK